MSRRFTIFGITIECSQSLPWRGAEAPVDLRLERSDDATLERGDLLHRAEDPGGELIITRSGARHVVSMDGWLFRFERGADKLLYCETGEHRATTFDGLLESVILPLWILLERTTHLALHGGALHTDFGTWLILGPSGAGKSTTTIELVRRGARMVSDDMTLVDVESREVLPGASSLRLWVEAGATPEAIAERAVAPDFPKRWVRLRDELTVGAPVKLDGVVFLVPRDDGRLHDPRGAWRGVPAETLSQQPGLTPVQGHLGLAALAAMCFDLTQPDRAWRAQRIRNLARLARKLPLFSFPYERDPQGRPTHVDRLVRDLQENM